MIKAVTYMSTVEEGEGLATVEDITVARLGVGLEVNDTSGGIWDNWRQKRLPSKGVLGAGRQDARFLGAAGGK